MQRKSCLLCERGFCVVLRLCSVLSFANCSALPPQTPTSLPIFLLTHHSTLFWFAPTISHLIFQFISICTITILVPLPFPFVVVSINVNSAILGTLLGGMITTCSEAIWILPPHPCGHCNPEPSLNYCPLLPDISMIIFSSPQIIHLMYAWILFYSFPPPPSMSSFIPLLPSFFFPFFLLPFLVHSSLLFLSQVSIFLHYMSEEECFGSVHLLLQNTLCEGTLHSNVLAELELFAVVFSFLLKQHSHCGWVYPLFLWVPKGVAKMRVRSRARWTMWSVFKKSKNKQKEREEKAPK